MKRNRLACVLVLLLVLEPSMAATIVVDETTCTLVDAITAANNDTTIGGCPAGSAADTIELTANVSLSVADNFAYSDNNGLPVVASEIVLDGRGFTIERDPGAPPFRLLAVADGGTLTISNLVLESGVSAQDGGAILNQGVAHLVDTTLSGNTAEVSGGAIAVRLGSQATLTNTTISGNLAGDSGGGIISGGTTLMVNSRVLDNVSGTPVGFAGGIMVDGGLVELANSIVSGNSGLSSGGIWAFDGALNLTDVTVSDNAGLGVTVTNASTSIRRTTISGNDGGGIVTDYGTLTLINTTVSGNTGSGIGRAFDANVYVTNCTVTGNSGTGFAGGLQLPAEISGSIVSNNGSNCSGNYISQGGNLADGDCGFGLITGLDPELADHGGATHTHALLPGSSAIDAAGECGLDTDQRGRPRNDGACDSGAYELTCEITVQQVPGETQIVFSPQPGPFSVVTGLLSELAADGDFSRATCLGTFSSSPAADVLFDPPVGDGRYYLARGLESCVVAGYGESSLDPDPRDALSAGPCP